MNYIAPSTLASQIEMLAMRGKGLIEAREFQDMTSLVVRGRVGGGLAARTRHLSLAGAIIRDRFRRPESAVAQKTSDVVCLIEAGATAGESPVWVAEEKALYWIDVYGPALYRAMTRQRATIGAGRSMS